MILPPTGGKVKRIPRQGCTAQTKRPRPTTPAAAGQNLKSKGAKFLSTPSARRATGHLYRQSPLPHISIHALREEGDLVVRELLLIVSSISIHALREEGDPEPLTTAQLLAHFYPRPPRGGRLGHLLAHFVDHLISIHALREEGDLMFKNSIDQSPKFLSTPSARRATFPALKPCKSRHNFYPRPPRGGRHRPQCRGAGPGAHFYPRPPRGGRPAYPMQHPAAHGFLSTPSARRATVVMPVIISDLRYFYPRPPRGGRQETERRRKGEEEISIHARRVVGDRR